jgi:hypothetical protein
MGLTSIQGRRLKYDPCPNPIGVPELDDDTEDVPAIDELFNELFEELFEESKTNSGRVELSGSTETGNGNVNVDVDVDVALDDCKVDVDN